MLAVIASKRKSNVAKHQEAEVILKGFFVSGLALVLSACTFTEEYRAFRKSHESIQPRMTFSDVFEKSLADYLVLLRMKNITGHTRSEHQPASDNCERHIMDIRYSHVTPDPGMFHVSVFCDSNLPSSEQVVPRQSFANRNDLIQALNTKYTAWSVSMKFRVESPAKFIGGVYDYYDFTIDQYGRVSSVSPINN